MPTVVCPTCGNTVRFEGLAGLCPACGTVVRVAQKKPQVPASVSPQPPPPKRPGRKPAPDLDSMQLDPEQAFDPAPADGPAEPKDPILFYLYVGAGAVIFIFAVYVALLSVLNRPKKPAPAAGSPFPSVSYNIAPPKVDAPVVVVPKPVETPTASTSKTALPPPPATGPAWASLRPALPAVQPIAIDDHMVELAITRAVGYLKAQFKDGTLANPLIEPESDKGADALCVYALLHAGEAIDDPDLQISSPFIRDLLDHLKEYDMVKDKATYQRSLRAQALGMFHRPGDQDQLSKDRDWLLKSAVGGAYSYGMPNPGAVPGNFSFDHSNSQYGVLGVWATAAAGQTVTDKYWDEVEQHWLATQDDDGGWGYGGKGYSSSLTMTCAGVTTLCLSADQKTSITIRGEKSTKTLKFSDAVNRALAFLGKGNTISEFGGHDGYALYGLERAALATGYRWFGDHDWFRYLGADQLKYQRSDGSWGGADSIPVETAFRLLFYSRGRQPIMMDKLRFDGDWDDRPRDLSKMIQFASAQLEKPFAWGIADLDRDWWDWLESPVLFITTDSAPDFSDDDVRKLRSYADAGGLIFVHNEFASREVDAFVSSLARRLYPQYPLARLWPTDVIFSSVFPIKTAPALLGVSNGTRTLLVYSPKDLTQDWVRWRPRDSKNNQSLQLGLNLFVDAAGKLDFRNRLNSPYIGPVDVPPTGTLPVYQVSYPGPWNPEPGAWLRFPRWFQQETGIAMGVQQVDINAMNQRQAPVAMLTGNAGVDFSKVDTTALHDYVMRGGVLLIDSTGGSRKFAQAVREGLLPRAFPGIRPIDVPVDHPILNGSAPCTDALPKPHLRNYTSTVLNGIAPHIQYASVGKGTVIISDLDITTGLLDSGTYATLGYSPAYCQSLVKNVILWALNNYHP